LINYKNISGKWRILDNETKKEFEGQLTINDANGIIYLEIHHDDPLHKDEFVFMNTPKHVKCINGVLINGAKISLMDCSVYGRTHFKSKSIIAFIAKYALQGVNLSRPDECVFTRMRYQIALIDKWANLNSFEPYLDEKYKRGIGNKEKGQITLLSNSEMGVILEPTFNQSQEGSEGRKKSTESIWICLDYKIPKNYDQSIKDIQKFLNLVSLGTGIEPYIVKVQGFNKKLYCMELNEKRIECPLEIITHFTPKKVEQIHPYFWLFSLKNLINKSYNLIHNWFSKYEKLEPIIELYFAVYRYEMTDKQTFLNLTQALETYHARFKAKTKSEYIERVHKILEQCPEINRKGHLQYLLDDEQNKRGNVLLRSRLSDLFLAEFKLFFLTGYKIQYEYVIKTVHTRNYLTHYSESKKEKIFTEDELPQVVDTLIIVLEYYLLLELGLPEEHIEKKIIERRRSIEYKYNP